MLRQWCQDLQKNNQDIAKEYYPETPYIPSPLLLSQTSLHKPQCLHLNELTIKLLSAAALYTPTPLLLCVYKLSLPHGTTRNMRVPQNLMFCCWSKWGKKSGGGHTNLAVREGINQHI